MFDMFVGMASVVHTAESSDTEALAAMREKCRAPVTKIQRLRWLAADVDGFFPGEDLCDPFDSDASHVSDKAPFASAEEAVEALQLVEHLRRMADFITVQVMDEIVQSHVVDGHGHASVRAMYDTATKQSGRDLHALQQVRKMFRRCDDIKTAAGEGDLSWEHLRLLARVYANKRVRTAFIDEQGWFLLKAARYDFRRFELRVNDWEEINDQDGPEPDYHEKRTASAVQDSISKAWQRHSTQGPLVGAAMANIEQAYYEAEFIKDWEAAKKIHGDKVCKDLLGRTDAQRRADAQAQIYADAASNPNSSAPFKIVLNIVVSVDAYTEMLRRYAGAAPTPFNVDTFRCETIDGRPLDINEVFADSLTGAFRRVIVDAKGLTLDVSEKRFFTGIARTALMISHDECEWVGCHVPASRCEGDHTVPKARGGPTTQANGTIFCKRHNRHKERGYTVWRDATTGQLRIKTPNGTEITDPWP